MARGDGTHHETKLIDRPRAELLRRGIVCHLGTNMMLSHALRDWQRGKPCAAAGSEQNQVPHERIAQAHVRDGGFVGGDWCFRSTASPTGRRGGAAGSLAAGRTNKGMTKVGVGVFLSTTEKMCDFWRLRGDGGLQTSRLDPSCVSCAKRNHLDQERYQDC